MRLKKFSNESGYDRNDISELMRLSAGIVWKRNAFFAALTAWVLTLGGCSDLNDIVRSRLSSILTDIPPVKRGIVQSIDGYMRENFNPDSGDL